MITEADIKKLADLCLVDDSDYKVEGINLINHGDKEGFTIKSIDSVTGVNALASRKPLEFGKKGITVVYGLNGAGKSGYIRIFKMISGAKYREDIKNNIPGAMDKYLGLLKSGGSDYPVNLVKKAGVDLTTAEPFMAVVRRLDNLLDELEKTLKN